jgi:hypothetical protein
MTTRRWWLPAIGLAAVLAGPAAALEVGLVVGDDAKAARRPGTVTSGVPFARGALKDVGKLSVSAGGKVVPAQFAKLAPWDDGSVRWALLDCQVDVPAGGKTELVLRDDGANRPPAAPVKVAEAAAEIGISTGPMEVVVDKKKPGIFKSIKVDGRELLKAGGRGLVLYAPGEVGELLDKGSNWLPPRHKHGPGRQVVAAPPDEVKVERAGPLRAVVMLRGRFPGAHSLPRLGGGEGTGDLLRYTVRVTAFAGRKFVKVRVWLENRGAHGYTTRENKPPCKPEWYAFDGMAVELGLELGGEVTAECEGASSSGSFKVLQVCKPTKEYSEASHTMKDFEYRITGGGDPGRELKKGARTDGVVELSGDGGKLTAAVRHFWQNYEKAVELDGSTLRVWLWPLEGQYPRAFPNHPCPGYATKTFKPLRTTGFYNLPGSVRKGHEMILDFSGREPAESAAELSAPLFALAPAEYYAATEAAPGFFAPPGTHTGDEECDAKLDAWVRMTRNAADRQGTSSIWHARRDRRKSWPPWDTGFWYGWMDFGDFAVPGPAAVSLHYDWPWIMTTGLMRTGDPNFLRLGTEMVRHRVEVDQQWSDRELVPFRGFQRPGTSYAHFHCSRFTGPVPSLASTWLAGVVLYYMLTGDPMTRECIDRTAAALAPAWERLRGADDYASRSWRGNMQVSARTMFSCCALYGLTADKKWLDLALKVFDEYVVPKYKRLGPHMHDRQQIRSQEYTKDDIKYCYSIHAFCLLHHYTGEERILEVLKAGCDRDFPANFFDAPLFLADLHAYVALKTGQENYADDAVEHWLEASPESKNLPVYLPGNSVWSRQHAMHLRAGHILQYYFWKKGTK